MQNLWKSLVNWDSKHLRTGPMGNSEFRLPETLNVRQSEAALKASEISLDLFTLQESSRVWPNRRSELCAELLIIWRASKFEWSNKVTAVAPMLWFVYSWDKFAFLDIVFIHAPSVFLPSGAITIQDHHLRQFLWAFDRDIRQIEFRDF